MSGSPLAVVGGRSIPKQRCAVPSAMSLISTAQGVCYKAEAPEGAARCCATREGPRVRPMLDSLLQVTRRLRPFAATGRRHADGGRLG